MVRVHNNEVEMVLQVVQEPYVTVLDYWFLSVYNKLYWLTMVLVFKEE